MEFHKDSPVFSSDDKEIGRVARVVIDPVKKQVTHLVVRTGVIGAEAVLETDLVAEATEDRVRLQRRADELKNLPPFEVAHFIPAGSKARKRTGTAPLLYWYPLPPIPDGFGAAVFPPPSVGVPVFERNIPKNTVPLREGARVTVSDGTHVGNVHEVIVDPRHKRITHFVITKGLFFKEHKLVPTSWIETLAENEVGLAVDTDELQALPEYQPT